ncbi:MAG: M23 family metallopeptidase [Bacteroidetes bacterium]|nr:MAG: M23 family metallopeptidase [Bacteroidota bacterium]
MTREAEALEKELYLSLVPTPDTPAKASTKASGASVAWPTEDTLAAHLLRVETYLHQLTRAEALLQSPILRSRWLPRHLPCACKELAVGFGQAHHPILGTPYPHRGIDFLVGEGAPIRTTAEGVVIKVEPLGQEEGTRVYVQHRPNLVTVYYPVAAQVQVGQGLAAGTTLGTLQRITLARAPFLHYEVWVRGEPVDPLPYLWGDLTWTERARWKAAFARQTYALH